MPGISSWLDLKNWSDLHCSPPSRTVRYLFWPLRRIIESDEIPSDVYIKSERMHNTFTMLYSCSKPLNIDLLESRSKLMNAWGCKQWDRAIIYTQDMKMSSYVGYTSQKRSNNYCSLSPECSTLVISLKIEVERMNGIRLQMSVDYVLGPAWYLIVHDSGFESFDKFKFSHLLKQISESYFIPQLHSP